MPTAIGYYGPEPIISLTGQPQRQALATIYLANSNTLASLYEDKAGTIPLQNPRLTDERGNLHFYAEHGEYDLALAGGYRVRIVIPETTSVHSVNSRVGDIVLTFTDVGAEQAGIAAALVATEISIRAAADANLLSLIDEIETDLSEESTARSSADTTETAARIAADSAISASLTDEISRAESSESTLTTNLSSEASTRAGADTTLTNNLNSEVTNRTNADANLQSQVDEIETDLGEESTARAGADTTLTNNLNAEITRAEAAESSEASTRASADTTLQTNITNEATTRANADSTLTTNLNAEITRAEAAESSEATTRASADTTLQSNIDELETDLTEEVTRAEAAEAAAITTAEAYAIQRANHTGTQLASTVSNFDTQVRTSRLDQMAAPTADVSLGTKKITNLADATAATDALNRETGDARYDAINAASTETTRATAAEATKIDKTLGGRETLSTIAAAGSSRTLDVTNGNIFDVTLDQASCTVGFTGLTNAVGCSITLILRQGNASARTVTWNSAIKWASATAPTLSIGVNKVDVLTFISVDGGTTILGFLCGLDIR